ncbi:MAG: sugar ABC transporter ATP-binding protein [Lachnospiraceae bacterium]|nr:sugar ABC transporter ATP-binding protein [Lachnospiraceae bacterium]
MGNAVEFKKINKHFPGAHVLKDVSFTVKDGEVHALLGENGAGKSTLLNILHGVYSEYEGDVLLQGKKVDFKNPNEAIVKGKISKVHQETNVVKDLTVGQNITLGYEPKKGLFINYKELNDRVDAILTQLKCRFKSSDVAENLSAGEMQMMAIAKALFHHSKIISLDEPTTSLTLKETEALFEVIRQLKKDGITILYVSHRLEEIFQICDSASILRDGKYIKSLNIADTNRAELIRNMVGRDVSAVAGRIKTNIIQKEILLKVEKLSSGRKFQDISFDLHRGEILGFFGLVGAGRTEVMRALFGADKKTSGKVILSGEEITIKNTHQGLKAGIGLIPEERKTQGFINLQSNINNVALSSLEQYMKGPFVDDKKRKDNCEKYIKELDIHPAKADFLTLNMSGGNQQKVILAKWMSTNVDVLIFDEPTKGVDVGAKVEIYRIMEEIAELGKGVILISSELPEVMGMSDRIIIMSEGKITGELNRDEYYEDDILNLAIGGNDNE